MVVELPGLSEDTMPSTSMLVSEIERGMMTVLGRLEMSVQLQLVGLQPNWRAWPIRFRNTRRPS